tara:strand:+ start:305 stop:913 length:609 start_codon:yes stop_codon:yes gene_type:complete
MKSKNGKAIAVILSFVAIAGVIGYVLYRRKKAKQSQSGGDAFVPETTPNVPQSTPSSGGGYSFPFKTTDEGNKFRVWVNTNYPAYAKQIDLSKSGLLNSYVDKAWKVYGAEYTSKVLNPSKPTTPTQPKVLQGWTNSLYTGLYDNVNDTVPYRNAGLYEYIGTTDGKTYTDYYGKKYYKMNANWQGRNSLFVKQEFVTFTKP